MIIGEPVHLPGSEYRVTQAIAALADHDEYRHAIERRAAKFAYRYPRLLLGALVPDSWCRPRSLSCLR